MHTNEFIVPTRAEQAKIANLFQQLDNLITLHQRSQHFNQQRHLEHYY